MSIPACRDHGPLGSSFGFSSIAAIGAFAAVLCCCGNDQPGSSRSVEPALPPIEVTASGAPGDDEERPGCAFEPPTAEQSAAAYRGDYEFTSDWFTPNIPHWRGAIGHFVGRPNVHYLEVGLYEGRSAVWMLENVLTHPTSHLTGIDVFPGNLEERWRENLRRTGAADRATTIKGYSQAEMRKLELASYDIIYIDGSHTGKDVLADAVLAWDLLREGGVLIFDDYRWRRGTTLPPELRPGQAIDAFITMNRASLEVVHRCYQLVVEKRADPCAGVEHCSPIGDYLYHWSEKALTPIGGDRRISLQARERDIIEAVLRSRRFGRTDFAVTQELAADPVAVAMRRQLGFDFLAPVPAQLLELREMHGRSLYSQHDEETFIRDFFADRRDGVFVDVGASDWRENSTTYFLDHRLGWTGIAIDARADLAAGYAENRPNTKFFSFFVSDESDATAEVWIVKQNPRLSSGADLSAKGRAHETVEVLTIRLTDLLDNQGITQIDFLSMDIELAEPKALAGFDIGKFRPELVCIEAHDEVRGQIEAYFAEHGYEKIERYSQLDPLNQYYRPAR